MNLVCSYNSRWFRLLALLTWDLPFEFFSSLLPVYSEEEGSDRYGGAECSSLSWRFSVGRVASMPDWKVSRCVSISSFQFVCVVRVLWMNRTDRMNTSLSNLYLSVCPSIPPFVHLSFIYLYLFCVLGIPTMAISQLKCQESSSCSVPETGCLSSPGWCVGIPEIGFLSSPGWCVGVPETELLTDFCPASFFHVILCVQRVWSRFRVFPPQMV